MHGSGINFPCAQRRALGLRRLALKRVRAFKFRMRLLAHTILARTRNPLHARVPEFAGAILVQMLSRMFRIFEIIRLANPRRIWGVLPIPFLGPTRTVRCRFRKTRENRREHYQLSLLCRQQMCIL